MSQISFKDYWIGLTTEQKSDLAKRLLTTQNYLSQLAYGHRRPSRSLAELAKIVTGQSLEFPACCED